MKIAIMQPYFLPYIGYWQLIQAVDVFIIYDNIKYTKKGWINRNRVCDDKYITLPLKKDSDYLNINQRVLSDTWIDDRIKIFNKLNSFYRNAVNFDIGMEIIDKAIIQKQSNLFTAINNSIMTICKYLNINTPIVQSSSFDINEELNMTEKILEICRQMEASKYINPIGGKKLYNKKDFKKKGIILKFIKSKNISYQRYDKYYPNLSIVDLIMFNKLNESTKLLLEYELI